MKLKPKWLAIVLIICGLVGLLQLMYPSHNIQLIYTQKHLPSLISEMKKVTPLPQSLAVYISAPGLSAQQTRELRSWMISELNITEVPYSKEKLMLISLLQGKTYTLALTYYPSDSAQPTHFSKSGPIFPWEHTLIPVVAMALMLL